MKRLSEKQPTGGLVPPCGHDEDALWLQATTSCVVYCQRCERGHVVAAALGPLTAEPLRAF